ncbi:hypothetical protein NRIC_29710 [Enterococcus florum]|uniref:Uncharacterized protein n=1 Tax=Enterococcus florum TaxID=2480627 RepID=A0A4P5PAT3_9ENTE|nr:hypothetical protein [Enterococcus florum]GCF95080.1 hypothetical protein NRIC_29710 [Enterococcus florum]
MSNPLFNQHQLFHLKRQTIEKRLTAYFNETRDKKMTIKYLVALQIRDQLSEDDFSFVLKELVRHLLLETKSTRALRRYYMYFQTYFSAEEWQKVTLHLFPLKQFVLEKVHAVRLFLVKCHPHVFSLP